MLEKYNNIGIGSVIPDITEEMADNSSVLGFINTEEALKLVDQDIENLPVWRILFMKKVDTTMYKFYPNGSTLHNFVWAKRTKYNYYFEGLMPQEQ
jgi:hypothetical protein